MKKVLASLVAVGLMATAANAATIGLRWAETPDQNLAAAAGTLEVWLELYTGDSASTVTFVFDASDPNLSVGAQGTTVPGWGSSGATGLLDGLQFASAANPGFNLIGPTPVTAVGSVSINVLGELDGSIKDIFALLPNDPVAVADASGAKISWDARYNDPGDAVFSPGYIAFGNWGNPGWIGMGSQPTPNPLRITKVPEPTSLALIALGGFAMLRRRR